MTRAATSERSAWAQVHDVAIDIRKIATGPAGRIDAGKIAFFARELQALADRMTDQLADGLHTNPPLIVWGNPKARDSHLMSKRVYAIEYQHVDDGEDYRHPFAAGVNMFSHGPNARQVTLYRPDGKPLSRDF